MFKQLIPNLNNVALRPAIIAGLYGYVGNIGDPTEE